MQSGATLQAGSQAFDVDPLGWDAGLAHEARFSMLVRDAGPLKVVPARRVKPGTILSGGHATLTGATLAECLAALYPRGHFGADDTVFVHNGSALTLVAKKGRRAAMEMAISDMAGLLGRAVEPVMARSLAFCAELELTAALPLPEETRRSMLAQRLDAWARSRCSADGSGMAMCQRGSGSRALRLVTARLPAQLPVSITELLWRSQRLQAGILLGGDEVAGSA